MVGNMIQELLIGIRYVANEEQLRRAKKGLVDLKRFAVGLGIGAGIAYAGKVALKTASDLEAAQAQFTTMLGSQAKAEQLMAQMWKYAAESTFEMSHVTHAMTTALQHSMAPELAFDTIKRLGDIAGANAPRFQRLALAMSQMNVKGRLTGEESRQFTNAGWNPLNQIAVDYYGADPKSMESMKKARALAEEDMRKRKITSDMVFAALAKVTSRGGMFFQNQQRQAETLMGRYTTMIDNLKKAGSDMVLAFSEPIKQIMVFIGTIDTTLIKEAFGALSRAVRYLHYVVMSSGFPEAWKAMTVALNFLLMAMGLATGYYDENSNSLRNLGLAISLVLQMLLSGASVVFYFGGVVSMAFSSAYDVIKVFAEGVWDARLAVLQTMLVMGIFASVTLALTIAHVGTLTRALIFLGFSKKIVIFWTKILTLWEGRAALATLWRAKVTGFLSAALTWFTTVQTTATAAVLFGLPAMWGMIAAVAVLIGAYYLLTKAIDKYVEKQERANFEASKASLQKNLEAKIKEKEALQKQYDNATSDEDRMRILDQIRSKQRGITSLEGSLARDWNYDAQAKDQSPEQSAMFGGMSYQQWLEQQKQTTAASARLTAAQEERTRRLIQLDVSVKGDPNAKTGASAQELSKAMESMFQTQIDTLSFQGGL